MVTIENHVVGDGVPCFVTFEAGPTHNGVESAKRLIDAAADAGGDAIKFQIFDPDRLVADRKLPFSYEVLIDKQTGATETVTEPLYDILCRRALSPDQWREVKTHADVRGLPFFSTVGFSEDIGLLEELECASIKIASADVNHFPLIRRAARTGMCIQLDTGKSTLGEIESAVDLVLSEGNDQIIIHQCPSGYPARLDSINLNVIPTLKRLFPGIPAAFSDHSPDYDMDIAAVALGANLIEKTITEDRMTPSVEHVMSLEPPQMRTFLEAIRRLETALGSSRRVMTEPERNDRYTMRRSVHLHSDLPTGHILEEIDFDYRRPGYGISPSSIDMLVGARLIKSKKAGERLSWTDLSW